MQVRANITASFGEVIEEHFTVLAFGESDYEDLIVSDIAVSDDWTVQFIVGDSPLALPAGLIWFEV